MNLLLLLSVTLAIGADASKNAVEKLDTCASQAVVAREKINDYHLTASITMSERVNDKLITYQYEFEAWRKGNHYRLDRIVIDDSNNKKEIGTRWIYCRNCEREGMKLTTYMGPNSISPVMISRLDDNDPRHYHIDWRYLGLRRSEIYNSDKRPDADLLTIRKCPNLIYVEAPKGAGRESRFHCDTGVGVVKIIFDSTVSNNPIFMYNDAKRGDVVLASETNVIYQEIDGIHYPKSFHYSNKQNGKKILNEVKLSVTRVDFNPDIDDNIFSLEGLNLREGQPIRLPEIQDSSQQPTWRNGKIDKDYTWSKSATEGYNKMADQKAANPVPDVAPGTLDGRWPYFLVAAFFAIAGILVGRIIRRG